MGGCPGGNPREAGCRRKSGMRSGRGSSTSRPRMPKPRRGCAMAARSLAVMPGDELGQVPAHWGSSTPSAPYFCSD